MARLKPSGKRPNSKKGAKEAVKATKASTHQQTSPSADSAQKE
nr:hypothetical protein [Streptococcus equi]